MPPKYSIISTCKGRLHNLKRTLPEFLKQEQCEVIIVDYDCPDGTANYVSQHHPQARVVSVKNHPVFNLAHARNLGAAEAKGQNLIFLDADVIIAEHFVKDLDAVMQDHSYARFDSYAHNSLRGSCVVTRKDFEKIGGYDDLMLGYGGEDLEMYMRLRFIGAQPIALKSSAIVDVIEQDISERKQSWGADVQMQFLRGQLYISAKEMVIHVLGTPVLQPALRKQMMSVINQQLAPLYKGEKDFLLEVNLPDKYKRRFLQKWEFSRSISVKAKRKKPTRKT